MNSIIESVSILNSIIESVKGKMQKIQKKYRRLQAGHGDSGMIGFYERDSTGQSPQNSRRNRVHVVSQIATIISVCSRFP